MQSPYQGANIGKVDSSRKIGSSRASEEFVQKSEPNYKENIDFDYG